MAISFACPACKTLIQVGEEMAGQTGQCPRCQRLLIIPSSHTPNPILLDANGNPVPTAPPTPARRDKPTMALPDDDEPTPLRRRTTVEKKPAGPMWPWLIGVVGAIVVFILLFSSFVTLFTYRPREARSNLIVVEPRRADAKLGVTHGRLEGNRAVLDQNGVFQMRSTLDRNDPIDVGFELRGHCKRFEVVLQNNRRYVVEVDCKKSSSFLRVIDRNNRRPMVSGNPGAPNANVEFFVDFDQAFEIHVGNFEDNLGNLSDFTLTIRHAEVAKPIMP